MSEICHKILSENSRQNIFYEYKAAAAYNWQNVKSAKSCRSLKCVQNRYKFCPSLRILQKGQKQVVK